MQEHPSFSEFEGFLWQEASGLKHAARIVRHLLRDCSHCRQLLVDMRHWRGKAASWDYSQAFAKAEHALDAYFAKGKTADITPEKLWDELSSLPQDQQELRVSTDRRFANPRLVHKLIEMSKATMRTDPTSMLYLANLARLVAVACTVDAAGSGAAQRGPT